MAKFEKGDRVKVINNFNINNFITYFKSGDILTINEKLSGSFLCTRDTDGLVAGIHEDYIELYNPPVKTIDNFKVGALLANPNEAYEMKIVAIAQNTKYKRFVTEGSDNNFFALWQLEDFKRLGWHLKPDYLELTKQQIADKFGVAVEQLKIVEEGE